MSRRNSKVDKSKRKFLMATDTKRALVVCKNVSVVRELTASEYFVSVDAKKIDQASANLRAKAKRLKQQCLAS
ncbi:MULTISPECIES: hypothetical protein [Vibrio]|uniref:hypothetical protein n=1 Tax=Vibrio TaxID=662 RepID=UPI0004A4F1D7|nr:MULTISPECIES: hypothetical protein [Vibrio]ATI46330.1 hypothetical protein CO725_11775 [Vibrio parahaemolyticus]EGR1750537.1 hypothetical protein [Vibrio parahaemolyticus]EHH1256030.1 hypothetical protein [Vibrio parahaemolyticus]ELJ8862212.1 hypothetical protein [Vibrio parahaemolyticus]KHF20565.1 hypothetical protein PO81_07410 [Vibrio parahaemolyticus]